VVDDDEEMRSALEEALTLWGYQASTARSGAEGLERLRGQAIDVALVDVRMAEMGGLQLLREIHRRDASIQVVIMTGYPDVETAVQALKHGACDYLPKPLDLGQLPRLLEVLTEQRRLRRDRSAFRAPRRESPAGRRLVHASPGMEQVMKAVAKTAPTDSPILIEGESGTGKELVASEIHDLSLRREGPFIPVDCTAIPGDLLESELFGHVRGAFSGAVADTLGLVRSAHGGTLFFDEVAELPIELQGKFLRFLQEKQIRPVGSIRTSSVDVRIIGATNRRLDEAVKAGSFRQDLFYRLNVVRIVIPPLRERKVDIPALTDHFIEQFNRRFQRAVKGVAPDAMAALMAYDFPGNVRELENLLERAYALGAHDVIAPADLPPLSSPPPEALSLEDMPTVAQAERRLILRALQVSGKDRDRAARILGISRRTLYRRLKHYGVL